MLEISLYKVWHESVEIATEIWIILEKIIRKFGNIYLTNKL